jgi:NAD(P)-dependent dehydrogenase (short-subunit alcohol dehydrogenase family)
MAKIFITGSADGLGQMAAKQLVYEGHSVVLHARSKVRGEEALAKVPGAEKVLIGDLSSTEETIQLASDINALGSFDAIIHNAGVYHAPAELILHVNTLAPYILTCLIQRPRRLIYLSSGMHLGGSPDLKKLESKRISYSDSKLHIVMLTMAVARLWPSVYANAIDPGWVPTKMGGKSAPDNLEKGYQTQTWLATSDEPGAKVTGHYFFHLRPRHFVPEASKPTIQNEFLKICNRFTGVSFPIN